MSDSLYQAKLGQRILNSVRQARVDILRSGIEHSRNFLIQQGITEAEIESIINQRDLAELLDRANTKLFDSVARPERRGS